MTGKTDQPEDAGQRKTARGTAQLAVAVLISIPAGIAIHVYLTRALAPHLYGVFAVVASLALWWEFAGVYLFADATTRFVADAQDNWRPVGSAAIRAAFAWSLILALTCAVSAPLVAMVLGDDSLTRYLWIFSIDIALYPPFLIFNQILRGRRRYGRWSGATIIYWAAKALLTCGLVALGLSVEGAILGSVGASVVGLVVAWRWSGLGLPKAAFPSMKLVRFGLPLMGVMVVLRTVESMDLWAIKALLDNRDAAGHYGAAKYLYTVATLLPVAVAGAALPTLTRAISKNDRESSRELIQQSFRFVFVTVLAVVALMGSSAKEIVVLAFSAPYSAAAVPARILMLGALLFSLRSIADIALVAAGKPKLCLAALAPMLPVNIALQLWLVPRYQMLGAALATTATGLAAATLALILVWREFRVMFSTATLLRSAGSAAAVFFLGWVVPGQGWIVVPKLLGLLAVYVALLTLSGELASRDFRLLLFWKR